MIDDEAQHTREELKKLEGMLVAWFGKPGDSVSGIFGHKREE
jgi:hypothetical protein